ncbi:ATP-dependent carboxylate-amine ligase [Haladaptatus sp. W1]|uniref:aspartyl protease family protein n=1 Tax=Haladaptatus sp. W1 TaxID=1897478 RepID=UPI0008499211|nr:aspartyl protease family protein [Haladaptatus sp. W1]ODR82061.1 ATP-dependent carboxylate-amine ligase [Haladaptatus sp. W1]
MARTDDAPIRVGVLSFHNSKETKAILNAVEDLGYTPVWLRKGNTRIQILDDEPRFTPDVDIVVNRLLLTTAEYPLEHLEIANAVAGLRPMVNRPDAVLTAIHKYATAVRLSNHGIRTPDSFLGLSVATFAEGRRFVGGPILQKAGIGTHGEAAWKVGTGKRPTPMVGNRHTFLQRFLDQDGRQSDVRVYVVGDEIVGAMRRSAPNGDWRTNVARGGTPENVTDEIPDEVRTIACEATHVLGLDVAGVDVMEWNGDWYVLEVNPTAGFTGLFRATGNSAAPFIARYAIERAGGEVASERVEAVARTLDDSIPNCKPVDSAAANGRRTVGYTEWVTVNGMREAASVVAKADTGATRTSIGIDLASRVGAGPVKSSATVKFGSGKTSKTRPLVDVDIGIGGRWHRVTASVEDRSHMRHHLILGRDVLSDYRVDIRRRANEE